MGMTARMANTLAELFRRVAAVEVVDGRVRARRCQLQSDGSPETAGRASNEGSTTGVWGAHAFLPRSSMMREPRNSRRHCRRARQRQSVYPRFGLEKASNRTRRFAVPTGESVTRTVSA